MSKRDLVITFSPNQVRHRAVIRPTADDPDDWDAVRIHLHTTPLHQRVKVGGKHVFVHVPTGWLRLRAPHKPCPRSHVPAIGNVLPGEGVLIVGIKEYDSLAADLWADGQCPSQVPDILVSQHLGKSMKSDRCVLVDDAGVVIATTRGDPEICWHPDGRLVLSETLKEGDIYDGDSAVPGDQRGERPEYHYAAVAAGQGDR
jgi:hypothetical protein